MTELLCALGSASAKELCYFTGAANATLRSLEKSGILRLEHREDVYKRQACWRDFVMFRHRGRSVF